MRKLRKNDQVIVISGRDKGKRGRLIEIGDKGKVLVEGVNVVKRHQKPNPSKNIAGGIVERTASISISNVAIFNPITSKCDRIGFRLLADGRKVRFYKATNDIVDV